ncbi:MAG: hypothetical protein GYA17_16635 [Chloroflexi bacterium]|nr:hypothetical protein [Anaerolineaceae bacterium]NMB89986.1 hypothetical protein [Chloroflexota bacterium]
MDKRRFPSLNLKINRKQLIVAGLLVLFVFLMMDLNNRLSELSRLSSEQGEISTEVMALRQTEVYLYTQEAYATSEVPVEEWAREKGLVRPGDVAIVPLAPENVTATPQASPTPTPQRYSNWDIWWMLFFGQQ